MSDTGGRDEECGSGREFNNQFSLLENKVAALRVIKVAEGGNSAPSKSEIKHISVFECAYLWTKIHRCTCKNTLGKISILSSVLKEGSHSVPIVPI